jgi:hexosaminidase
LPVYPHGSTASLLQWSRTSSSPSNTSLSKGSYGPPYTLTLNVSAPFTLFGPDTTLSLSTTPSNYSSRKSTSTSLIFTTNDNFSYPLRRVSPTDGFDPGHPGRIWTNQSSSSHEEVSINLPAVIRLETDVVNGTRVWVNEKFAGRFEVFVYGGRNTLFSWSQMAMVAPLEEVRGGIEGMMLEAGVGDGMKSMNENLGVPYSSRADGHLRYEPGSISLVVVLMSVLYFVAL